MTELRLFPGAAVVWAATAIVLLNGWQAACIIVMVVAAAWLLLRQRGQGIACGGIGLAAVAVAAIRKSRAQAFEFTQPLEGRISAAPTQMDSGTWLLRLRVEGFPAQLPVFVKDNPGLETGSRVSLAASFKEASRPGLSPVVAEGSAVGVAPPRGWAHVVAGNFRELVSESVGPASQGLFPGMVLGDTTLQESAERDLYVAAGLSHLSAVSGANVAIICSAAALVCAAFALGPAQRVTAAAAALAGFVLLVGFEPSVQRAAVAGMVGLLAVLNSSRMQPLHALSLGIIVLILVDSELALSFGFALSTAATAGIVVLSPVIVRFLAPTGWPEILVRALAVALAADVVTMPVVALMAGEVSVVSVLANLLVSPVAAPITILGVLAAACAQLGPIDILGTCLLKVAEPCTWWINTVAHGVVALPVSTVAASPWAVALVYGWILLGLAFRRPLLTLIVVVCAVGAAVYQPGEVDISRLRTHEVSTESEIAPVPAGTQVIIVRGPETGDTSQVSPRRSLPTAFQSTPRPTRTKEGIPVLYPSRDGPVRLYRDGVQHSSDGRF
ncbi:MULTISPECIES: ComEC/Rec2 family competence protein [Corynebacterium]|uniref:ComEC/Rec2 family competence protein n=1 Tax=Corynebacterium TaxID=1716 RepID=UPI0025795005|nr:MULTISPECIES: ComEC/Rec2 family competence protein [Corynebacterium]